MFYFTVYELITDRRLLETQFCLLIYKIQILLFQQQPPTHFRLLYDPYEYQELLFEWYLRFEQQEIFFCGSQRFLSSQQKNDFLGRYFLEINWCFSVRFLYQYLEGCNSSAVLSIGISNSQLKMSSNVLTIFRTVLLL